MFDSLEVASHKGLYSVHFSRNFELGFDDKQVNNSHIIIDRRVADLYKNELKNLLSSALSVLEIEANEQNKSLEAIPAYVEYLVTHKLRRNQQLIAIGGGVIQDITCFLAANVLRGVDWCFIPTTLLAQADSCIGSKSSINCSEIKNILGTFTPPKKIVIDLQFLKTLEKRDICSGIGEMLKVHAIAGPISFSKIAADYYNLFEDSALMTDYIKQSLMIKKSIIEQDEFDFNIRQVMNYGHSFGHAIEVATQYAIPHGIAVTIGMDMANYIAMRLGRCASEYFENMHPTLLANYQDFQHEPIVIEKFLSAISKDKKNTGSNTLNLILPNESDIIEKFSLPRDTKFLQLCSDYFVQQSFNAEQATKVFLSHADNMI